MASLPRFQDSRKSEPAIRSTGQKITAIIDGQIRPICTTPLFSSAGTRWSGFVMEEHEITQKTSVALSFHETIVGLSIAGTCTIRVAGAIGQAQFVARPGHVFVSPAGLGQTEFDFLRATKVCRARVVQLDERNLSRLLSAEERPRKAALIPQITVDDPHVRGLLTNMYMEIAQGCPSGPLYQDSLCLALAAHLWGLYRFQPEAPMTLPRFSRSELRRALEYIDDHLGRNFNLVELASALSMSCRHFFRMFRNTLGVTPYRYILHRRIDRAKNLLSAKERSIAEIASALGFADQSHFTHVFLKTTGLTPRRYQKEA